MKRNKEDYDNIPETSFTEFNNEIPEHYHYKKGKFLSLENYNHNLFLNKIITFFISLFNWRVWLSAFKSLLLPKGYPESVTEDYINFQIWDTLQAVTSYFRGILCVQAVLEAVGVGNIEKTASAAAINWVLRDGMGMIGGMLFTWKYSSSFGKNVKLWRIFADTINDIGLFLELYSPYLDDSTFLYILCVASTCRALCGAAAGATRVEITAHFARSNNLADVQSKEGIQETFVTLIGILFGALISLSLQDSPERTWLVFMILTFMHVFFNILAMNALHLTSLNLSRFEIIAKYFLWGKQKNCDNTILSPSKVSHIEGIFYLSRFQTNIKTFNSIIESKNIFTLWFRWFSSLKIFPILFRTFFLSNIHIGVNLHSIVHSPKELHDIITSPFSDPEKYLILQKNFQFYIALNNNANLEDIITALFKCYSEFIFIDFRLAKSYAKEFIDIMKFSEWNINDIIEITCNSRFLI